MTEHMPGPKDPRPPGCRCGDMPSPRCPVHGIVGSVSAARTAYSGHEPCALPPDEAHTANEWADMASNCIVWLRNIRDGISTPVEALAEMESNLRRIMQLRQPMARSTLPPSPDYRELLRRSWLIPQHDPSVANLEREVWDALGVTRPTKGDARD